MNATPDATPAPLEPGSVRFATLVTTDADDRQAQLMVASLRAFGGRFRDCPVWIFLPNADRVGTRLAEAYPDVEYVPLAKPGVRPRYYFSAKVSACAQAEGLCDSTVRHLVWSSAYSMVVKPPEQYDLGSGFDAAFRPVHHQNIGLEGSAPMDAFWLYIYRAFGMEDTPLRIESYADQLSLRPYFNTHTFAVNPELGLLRTWWKYFQYMVSDELFQRGACRAEAHQIFLHQAILSTLLVKELAWERVRLLPPGYSYPLHMHREIAPARRAQCLNELICPVFEEYFQYPHTLNGLAVQPPLDAWLANFSLQS